MRRLYTDEMPPDVEKQPDVVKAAVDAGKLLGHRLGDGHDRAKVTKEAQEKVMALFGVALVRARQMRSDGYQF